jgi:hypothetical protein
LDWWIGGLVDAKLEYNKGICHISREAAEMNIILV